jgi:hypothetical protein
MISAIIRWSISNRLLVLLATVALIFGGLYSVKKYPRRCDSGLVRCSGNHQDQLSGTGTTSG